MKTKAFLILLCCIFMTSCSNPIKLDDYLPFLDQSNKPYNPQEISSDDHPFAVETMEEIIRCLDENDSVTLKKLLSQEVLNKPETEKEIEEMMKIYDGKSVSYDDVRNGITTSSARNGEYKQKGIYILAENLVNDTDFKCDIDISYILVDEDTDRIGLHSISLVQSDGVEICAVNTLRTKNIS